jgi:hypothetical protein
VIDKPGTEIYLPEIGLISKAGLTLCNFAIKSQRNQKYDFLQGNNEIT